MTFESAKKTIDEMTDYWRNNKMTFSELKALECSSEALEKQIPKKITHDGFCPNCKIQYPMYPPSLNKYCGNCGQKLDWD